MAGESKFTGVAPQFVVPDVVVAAEFYREKLGFEILGYFHDPPVFAMVKRGMAEIHLGKADGEGAMDFSSSVASKSLATNARMKNRRVSYS